MMKNLDMLAKVLVIIGGLNWGLMGLMDMNLVDMLLGGMGLDRLAYVLVGLSALWMCKDFMPR